MRFILELPQQSSKIMIEKAVLGHPKTNNYLKDGDFKKIIIVPNKIVNIVF